MQLLIAMVMFVRITKSFDKLCNIFKTTPLNTSSQAPQRQPPLPRVRQVLRERGILEEALGLPPRDGCSVVLHRCTQDVAMQRLHSGIHARKW